MQIKINGILEQLELSFDTGKSYLNRLTGEFIYISDDIFDYVEDDNLEGLADWEKDLTVIAKEINETDNYVQLPTKYEVNEYAIMEKFCQSVVDDRLKEILYSSIKGSGAFGRFKEIVRKHNIQEDWFSFRTEELKMIATDWCERNKLQLIAG